MLDCRRNTSNFNFLPYFISDWSCLGAYFSSLVLRGFLILDTNGTIGHQGWCLDPAGGCHSQGMPENKNPPSTRMRKSSQRLLSRDYSSSQDFLQNRFQRIWMRTDWEQTTLRIIFSVIIFFFLLFQKIKLTIGRIPNSEKFHAIACTCPLKYQSVVPFQPDESEPERALKRSPAIKKGHQKKNWKVTC